MNHLSPTIRLAAIGAALFFFSASTSRVVGVENWTSYRGPTDQGGADDANLPLEWSENKNVAWKTRVDGKAWSSPVIWGDRIFLTNAPPDGSSLSILCIDKQTGEILYNKRLHSVPLPQYCHPFNSYASPSPVVEEGRVYVSFGSTYNACLDSTTEDVLWERTDFVCNHFRGAGSSLLMANDLIYAPIGSREELWAIRPDGRGVVTDTHVAWKQKRAVPGRPSVLLVRDLLFMVNNSGVGACVEADTGKPVIMPVR